MICMPNKETLHKGEIIKTLKKRPPFFWEHVSHVEHHGGLITIHVRGFLV